MELCGEMNGEMKHEAASKPSYKAPAHQALKTAQLGTSLPATQRLHIR
jgi:hypothetical protein